MSEAVQLKSRKGEIGPATAEVTRLNSGQRTAKAGAIGVGGTIVGLCTIVIPGVHLISTWAIPLLSIGIAWYFYNQKGSATDVVGECPTCGGDVSAEGGPWEEPMWVRCSACQAPLEVVLNAPMLA